MDNECKSKDGGRGVCFKSLSQIARGGLNRDLDVVIGFGTTSSTNAARIGKKLGLADPATIDEVAKALLARDSVELCCNWSAELNTLFHMGEDDLRRVARVTLLSTTQGSDVDASAVGTVLEAVLPENTVHQEHLHFRLQDGGVDGLHGHQQAFARRLMGALAEAHRHRHRLVVVATGGFKIQAMISGAFAYATGTRMLYMHERFEHRVVEFGNLHGLFEAGADNTGDLTGLLREGTMPWADVPRTSGAGTAPMGRSFELRLAHEVKRRGWTVGEVLVNKDLSMQRHATPCEVVEEQSDEGPVLVARIYPFTLRVRPQQAAWSADPHGLRDELAGLILSELGK